MKIKLLSFNIHKGLSAFNQSLTIGDIKTAILEEAPDLVCLQEVIGEHIGHQEKYDNWPDESQYEYLADTIWKYYSYAQNAVYPEGHHGNLVLSKFPIVEWDNYDISTNNMEKRGILHTKIKIPKNEQDNDQDLFLHTFCTHLNLTQRGRNKQYEMFKDKVNELSKGHEPVIIAGDFNDWNKKSGPIFEETLGMKEVFKEKYGNYAKTFPSFLPFLSLDRIFIKNINLINCETKNQGIWRKLSDHVGLIAELEIPTKVRE